MIVTIRQAVASIYKALRDICGYIMLAGLIFTGIKILLTANNPQKQSQWRALIFDWVVGMILLIFSHVIMVGIFYISDTLVHALGEELNGFGGMNFALLGRALISFDSAEQVICLIMVIYLMYLTIVFAIAYFKRVLWINVLTIMAPIVSCIYVFGNQTKQIYSKWFKEYITTVLVQPFHIIVYYILISIPLNMVNTANEGFAGMFANPIADVVNLLEIIYALGAMSFIRPAEKYIRNLFGMEQGIVALASFDSGKQTLDEIRKMIQKQKEKAAKVGKSALTIVGAAVGTYFGGAAGAKIGAQAGKAVGSMGEKVVKDQNKRSNERSKMLDYGVSSPKNGNDSSNGEKQKAQEAQEAKEDAKREQQTNAAVNALSMSGGGGGGSFGGGGSSGMNMQAGGENAGASGMNISGSGEGGAGASAMNISGSGEGGAEANGMNMQAGGENAGASGMIGPMPFDGETLSGWSPIDKASIENGMENISGGMSPDTTGTDLEEGEAGITENGEVSNKETGADSEEAGETSKKSGKKVKVRKRNVNSSKKGLQSSGESESSGQGELNETTGSMNVGQLNVVASNVVLDGNNIKQNPINTDSKIVLDNAKNDKEDNGGALDLSDGVESLSDKILSLVGSARDTGFFDDVKDLGNDLYKGFNQIRDTFYAPTAPSSKDWQTTLTIREEKQRASEERRKDRVDKIENKFVKNEGNKQFIMDNLKINGMSVMDYYRDKYDGQGKSDAYIKEQAEERIEKELEKIKGYASYGMDARQAYPLYQDQKKYGFTREEAIRNNSGFESFNTNIDNITFINDKYSEQGIQVDKVSDIAPNAREYYANGYRDIREILDLNYLEQKLNVTCERAMQIDSVLRKKLK